MPYAHGLSPQRATRAASALLACQHLRELDGRVVGANTAQRIREAGLGLECELYDTQFDAQVRHVDSVKPHTAYYLVVPHLTTTADAFDST